MNNLAELCGSRLSASAATFVLEAFKAALVTIGASVSILVFNISAKKREQDSELFNELIHFRIKASHDANRAVSRLLFDYLDHLEAIYRYHDGHIRTFKDYRRDAVKYSLTRKDNFLAQLPARTSEIRAMVDANRYELGQVGFDAISGRLRYIEERATYLWKFYKECIENWRLELELVCCDPADVPLAVAEIIAFEGSREVSVILNALEGDFERVIRAKGAQRAFIRPRNIDYSKGILRINPLKSMVRYKLGLLMMEKSSTR